MRGYGASAFAGWVGTCGLGCTEGLVAEGRLWLRPSCTECD